VSADFIAENAAIGGANPQLQPFVSFVIFVVENDHEGHEGLKLRLLVPLMIVTIDGPAGSGKSTAARMLAARLGFHFLDTGAMYRAVALACLEAGIDPHDADRAAALAADLSFELHDDRIVLNGRDVSQAIRTDAVSAAASVVATHSAVRRILVRLQQETAAGQDFVSEGRDQGTVAFPEAACKFFLTADPDERARRRCKELEERGERVSLEDMRRTIRERDERDAAREHGPMRQAPDAVVLDTSGLTLEEVTDKLEQIVRDRGVSLEGRES
jgi:cytidylate kinase